MENISLTSEEKKELKKRGFLIKTNFDTFDFFKSIFFLISFFGIASSAMIFPYLLFFTIGLLFESDRIMTIGVYVTPMILLGIVGLSIINYISSFIKSGKTFYTKNENIGFGKIDSGHSLESSKVFFINNIISRLIKSGTGGKGGFAFGLLYIAFILIIIISSSKDVILTYSLLGDLLQIGQYILLVFISILGVYGILFFLKFLFQSLHPLYAFGNLGEKIQKLTPEIESQSKLIQSEFQKDMNFSILHSGFEKLSTTFSSIVALVLKLEKIEARANKGNLFDSEKYIGSLRTDIVTPLTELKKFLEGQRKQLLESQQELSRVRVGGPDTSANIELQSKRSESLLQELDTNIAALGEMVEKMG